MKFVLEDSNLAFVSESQKIIVPLRGNRARFKSQQKSGNYLKQEKGMALFKL